MARIVPRGSLARKNARSATITVIPIKERKARTTFFPVMRFVSFVDMWRLIAGEISESRPDSAGRCEIRSQNRALLFCGSSSKSASESAPAHALQQHRLFYLPRLRPDDLLGAPEFSCAAPRCDLCAELPFLYGVAPDVYRAAACLDGARLLDRAADRRLRR